MLLFLFQPALTQIIREEPTSRYLLNRSLVQFGVVVQGEEQFSVLGTLDLLDPVFQ